MAKQSAFQIFNQKLKEKIGVAEQVTTYPEEPELSTKLEILTNQIKKITREIHKQEKTTTTLLEAGTELSDSLVDGGVSFREDPLRYMLAGGLDKVAEVQRHVDDLRSKLGKQIVSEVYEPLDNVIEVDVKEAKMQKSKFEKTRVELDAGISKLNGLGKKAKEEKIKEVELEVENLRKNFSQVGMETVDKLQDTIALSEAEMLGSLVHYMELYRDFFTNSNRFMVSLIPEIEEYKNYIEMQREQLHGSAIAKQIEIAAAAAPPEKKFGTLKLKGLKSSFGMGDKKKTDKGTPASEIFTAKAENDPFGKDIEQVANKDGSDVPVIVDKAVEYIENKGLKEEGIFRISASKKEVDKLKGEIAETADETTSSPEVVAEKKPDESSSSSESGKKKKEANGEKHVKKDPVRQRSAGSLMIKKTSEEDLRKARRLERAHTISVGIADPSHPANTQPLPDTPSKKGEKSVEEPHEEGAKKKHHAPTSPRFKNFIKKLSFRAEKKDKIEKKEEKVEGEVKVEKDDKKHEKKDKEKKTDEKKLDKEKKDEEKRLEKERKELEKKKKKEAEAAEKDAKKKDKKQKGSESTPPESKSHEDSKKDLKKSSKDKKEDLSSSSDSVVKYEYKPVDAHMSINLPGPQAQGATSEAVTTPVIEVEQHKSGEEKKVEVEVKAETETKSVEEKKPEIEIEVKNRSRSSSSSSSSAKAKTTTIPEIPHESTIEVQAPEVKNEAKEPEVAVKVAVDAKPEPVQEVKEASDVTVIEPEVPKEVEVKSVAVEIERPKEPEIKEEKTGAVSPLTLSGEDDKEKEAKKKREKEEKARKEKEESAKKKLEKEAKKKEKEDKEREEKERKKAEKENKKKPEKEKEKKKDGKKAEQTGSPDEESSSSEEKEKKGKKSPKWLQKLKPKAPKKKDDAEKTSPRDEAAGDLVLNRKKKAVVVETNELESSINSPRPQLTDSTSEKSQAPASNSASEIKQKLESTEKARAENQTHIEEQTRSVLSSVGSKLDELENQLNTLDLSISPRASATIPAEASPRGPDTPASREKLGNELQNLEAMLNNMPADESVKHETPSATPVIETSVEVSITAPVVDEHPKETKDESSSSSSS